MGITSQIWLLSARKNINDMTSFRTIVIICTIINVSVMSFSLYFQHHQHNPRESDILQNLKEYTIITGTMVLNILLIE